MSLIENLSWGSISVWKRNRDVFFRTWKTNFVPSFLEPVLYLLAMGMGFGVLISEDLRLHDMSVDYIEFLAPGLIAISIMYGAFFECTYGSFVRMHYQKTFDAMIATPLSIEDVIVGEILWGATKSFLNATIVLLVISLFGLASLPGLIFVPFIAFLGGLMFASIAMLFTSITPNMDSFNWPFFLLITPMFLFSGTFFPMYVLPEWGQTIALALPLTHCSVLVRDLCFNYFDLADVAGLAYIAVMTVVAFFASIHLMKKRLIN
ncbi:MAG: ABC transporter permease [Methanomassiliicoccales archaeon]|jgi:lipooligosaccharide transport system permease protein